MNYYIADCHFGHANSIIFDHRPFQDVEQMEQVMVMNWNAAVKRNDTVYILGDFVWGKADEWLRILRLLKGNKVLIRGNHDLKQYPSELKNQFADITYYKEIIDNGTNNENRRVILSHYPIMFYKHSYSAKAFMLCGHVHSTRENDYLEKWISELKQFISKDIGPHFFNRGQIFNVGVMMPWVNYTPRTLDEIIRNREKHLNSMGYPPVK